VLDLVDKRLTQELYFISKSEITNPERCQNLLVKVSAQTRNSKQQISVKTKESETIWREFRWDKKRGVKAMPLNRLK